MSDNMYRGPWKLQAHDNYMRENSNEQPLEIIDCDGEVVACNTTYYPTELGAKYAHLIAAAPELYEALEMCLEELMVVTNVVGRGIMTNGAISTAESSLAKARGETL